MTKENGELLRLGTSRLTNAKQNALFLKMQRTA